MLLQLPDALRFSHVSARLHSFSAFCQFYIFFLQDQLFSRSSLMDSAPMPARNALYPIFLLLPDIQPLIITCLYSGLTRTLIQYNIRSEYSTFSRVLGDRSKISPIRLGIPLKYQMCDTGAARAMWPMRSRYEHWPFVTSTPQRSQTTPL